MLASVEECTGCMACLNICPVGCISNKLDTEGFYEPVIDEKRCIQCGKCTRACPILQDSIKDVMDTPEVYAAWNKDENVLNKSSSGGIFGALAKHILEEGGVVFGAAYSKNLVVEHVQINSMEELNILQGSKYVQSDIGESFKSVKKALIENKYVLFNGTPCQVAGLYGYLGTDKFQKLITCDLVCHGVPSPGVFKSYINYLEVKQSSKLHSIQMRTKKRGWNPILDMRYVYQEEKEIELKNAFKDPYMNGFLYSLYLRRSCYNCKYAKTPRESDITIADFWGIGNEIPFKHPVKQGISLVLVNSNKGKELFEHCKDYVFFEERTLEEAKKGNVMLSAYQNSNPYRSSFFEDYQTNSFEELIPRYLKRRQSVKQRMLNIIVKVVGRKNLIKIKRLILKG